MADYVREIAWSAYCKLPYTQCAETPPPPDKRCVDLWMEALMDNGAVGAAKSAFCRLPLVACKQEVEPAPQDYYSMLSSWSEDILSATVVTVKSPLFMNILLAFSLSMIGVKLLKVIKRKIYNEDYSKNQHDDNSEFMY